MYITAQVDQWVEKDPLFRWVTIYEGCNEFRDLLGTRWPPLGTARMNHCNTVELLVASKCTRHKNSVSNDNGTCWYI